MNDKSGNKSTKESGYVLQYNFYSCRGPYYKEFSSLKKLRDFLINSTEGDYHHLIWYRITKRIESGTYTDEGYTKWKKGITQTWKPEAKI